MSACAAITKQQYFDPGLPNGTLCTLYRANVRSVLLYGTPILKDTSALEELDVQLLQNYFKKLLFLTRVGKN